MESAREIAPKSPSVRRRKDPLRSRIVGNRSSFLPTSDGRSVWARIARDTLQSLETHCGSDLSVTKALAARRVSVLEAELVFLEDEFAHARAEGLEPDPAKVDLYGRLSDRQRRLAEAALGWEPTLRNVTPSLAQIQAEHDAEEVQP
jgi:hypothetical protein